MKNVSINNTFDFLGVAFDILSLDQISSIIGQRQNQDSFQYIVTPNVDHVVRLHSDPVRYRPLYEDAAYRLCDSKILHLLGRLAGRKMPVVAGSDLTRHVFEHHINKSDRICVIGGGDAVVKLLIETVGADALFHCNPPMGFPNAPSS